MCEVSTSRATSCNVCPRVRSGVVEYRKRWKGYIAGDINFFVGLWYLIIIFLYVEVVPALTPLAKQKNGSIGLIVLSNLAIHLRKIFNVVFVCLSHRPLYLVPPCWRLTKVGMAEGGLNDGTGPLGE